MAENTAVQVPTEELVALDDASQYEKAEKAAVQAPTKKSLPIGIIYMLKLFVPLLVVFAGLVAVHFVYLANRTDTPKQSAQPSDNTSLPLGSEAEYLHRGWAYYTNQEWERAITEYTEAIRLNPKFAEAYLYRGSAYYSKEEWDKTIADSSEVIRLDPKIADAYYIRGLAYYQKKKWGEAIDNCSEAIRLNPKNASAYFCEGNAYKQKGDSNKANKDFAKAKELGYQP